MIELNKKNSKSKNTIKDSFKNLEDIKSSLNIPSIQGSLNIPSNLSTSLSDIDKITKKATQFKSRFVKFLYFIAFIILIYIIYKIYTSFIRKKKINTYTLDTLENDIKKILDNFN